MKRKFIGIIMSICLFVGMLFCFTGCDMPTTDSTDNMNNSERYDGLTVILNGHVGDENDNNNLVTPCYFLYDHKMAAIQTEIWEKFPNDSLGLYSLPKGYHYLVVSFTFRNGTKSDISVNVNDFQVYADNHLCEQTFVVEDNFPYSATVSAEREATVYGFFSVPKDASLVEIEYESSWFSDKLVFAVQGNGRLTDEDMEEVKAVIERLQNGMPAQVEETEPAPDPNAPVVIIEGKSDSFYHSNSANKDYSIDLTYDGNYKTSWQDGSDDDAVGETLTYKFAPSDITRVEIVNGNRKDKNSYSRNNRLAIATLTFFLDGSQVHEEIMEFEDDVSIDETVLNLESPVSCDSIVITIDEVFPGSDYSDTGIAEVMFFTN